MQTDVQVDDSANGWTYADVSGLGVQLQDNTQYVIVSNSMCGFQYTADGANIGLGAGIASYDGNRHNNSNVFDSDVNLDYTVACFGPNFQYIVVTAPASAAALGLGLAVTARRRRA